MKTKFILILFFLANISLAEQNTEYHYESDAQAFNSPKIDDFDKAWGCASKSLAGANTKRVASIKAKARLIEKLNGVHLKSEFKINRKVTESNNETIESEVSSNEVITQVATGDIETKTIRHLEFTNEYCVLVGRLD